MRLLTALRSTIRRVSNTSRGGGVSTMGTLYRDRRTLLKAAVGLGLVFGRLSAAAAEDPKTARPQAGDRFLSPFGARAGQTIKPADDPLGGRQQLGYPRD